VPFGELFELSGSYPHRNERVFVMPLAVDPRRQAAGGGRLGRL